MCYVFYIPSSYLINNILKENCFKLDRSFKYFVFSRNTCNLYRAIYTDLLLAFI